MTDEEEYVDGTWEPEGRENAVTIQPSSIPLSIQTKPIKVGPTLQKEFSVIMKFAEEPAFAPEIETYERPKEKEEAYFGALNTNKIGGAPQFTQGDEFPEGEGWKLLLQLDSTQVPFYINFGDAGTGYAFINGNGTQWKFLWQC